jgi:hypothetical protein
MRPSHHPRHPRKIFDFASRLSREFAISIKLYILKISVMSYLVKIIYNFINLSWGDCAKIG